MPRNHQPRRQAGVTLIELMVVVVVIAILATFAVRSFARTRQRAGRQDAAACLTLAANRQEIFYERQNTPATTLAQLGLSSVCGPNGAYTLSTMTCATEPTVCYGFQASPDSTKQAGRAQAADGTLKLEIHYRQKRPDQRALKFRQPATGAAITGWS